MRRSFALAVLWALFGCDQRLAPDLPAQLSVPVMARTAEIPTTAEGFLAELSPLAAPAVRVVYDVNGPTGLTGTLEVLLGRGGLRRENWSLDVEVDGEPVPFQGSTVQTPEAIFTTGPQGQAVAAVPLRRLAEAYVAADPATRSRAVATLRRLHASVAVADFDTAPQTDTLLGITCRRMRLASQDLCMWDGTGLPLRYTGDAFQLHAVRVELDPDLTEAAFQIATPAPGPVEGFDANAALQALAAGSYGVLGPWLHPGLRFPDPGAAA